MNFKNKTSISLEQSLSLWIRNCTMIFELFEYAFAAVALFYLISILVKQDLQDQSEPPCKESVEELKPVVEVLDIESMTPSEKVQTMISRLDKMEKLLFSEQKLNDFHQCLVKAQQLKRTTDNPYQIEREILNQAISWLEKPLVTRGQFDSKSEPSSYNKEEIYLQIENLIETIWLVLNPDRTLMHNENYKTIDLDFVNEDQHDGQNDHQKNDQNDLEKPNMAEVITLKNVLEFSRWLLFKVKCWSPELIRCASDTVKVWFVVFMAVRFAVLSPKRLKNTTKVMYTFSAKIFVVQTKLDHENNETTVILNLFPSNITLAVQTSGGYYGYFKKLLTRMKLIFKH